MHGEGFEARGDLSQDVDLVRYFSSADLELFPLNVLHFPCCAVEIAVPVDVKCKSLHQTVSESIATVSGDKACWSQRDAM